MLLPLLFSIILEVSGSAVRQEKEIKVIRFKRKIILSLVTDYLIIYIENKKESMDKVLIREFSKVVRYNNNYKINFVPIHQQQVIIKKIF